MDKGKIADMVIESLRLTHNIDAPAKFWYTMDIAALEKFAEMIAKAERKECVKICDDFAHDRWSLYKGSLPYTGKEPDRANIYISGMSDGANECSALIEDRKES